MALSSKLSSRLTSLVLAAALLVPAIAGAAGMKKYQVTGKITALTDTMITVDKAGEPWEVQRTADLSIDGKLKVGEKVTIYYHMVADSVKTK